MSSLVLEMAISKRASWKQFIFCLSRPSSCGSCFQKQDLFGQYIFCFCVYFLFHCLLCFGHFRAKSNFFSEACLARLAQLYGESLPQSELKGIRILQEGHKTPHRALGDLQACACIRAPRDIAVSLVAVAAASLVNMNFLYIVKGAEECIKT